MSINMEAVLDFFGEALENDLFINHPLRESWGQHRIQPNTTPQRRTGDGIIEVYEIKIDLCSKLVLEGVYLGTSDPKRSIRADFGHSPPCEGYSFRLSTNAFSSSSSSSSVQSTSIATMVNKHSIRGVALDSAGLVALADLSTISQRTALTGSATYFDVLLLAPGIHRQQAASEINGGELPTAGAMTSGFVFRIENQGTVSYLQGIGEPGCLVTVRVDRRDRKGYSLPLKVFDGGFASAIPYLIGIFLTPIVFIILGLLRDFWAIGVLFMLMVARLINVEVIRRRSAVKGWKGASEPGVRGDLLILLSQDRWVRMRGLVDDIKEVTAGQWLRDQTTNENFMTAFATLLVYVSAALASNASTIGSLIIACLLLASVGLLGLCNSMTKRLQMFGCVVYQEGEAKRYKRRLDMAEELVASSGRDDWAINMGLIVAPKEKSQNVHVVSLEMDSSLDVSSMV